MLGNEAWLDPYYNLMTALPFQQEQRSRFPFSWLAIRQFSQSRNEFAFTELLLDLLPLTTERSDSIDSLPLDRFGRSERHATDPNQ